LVTNKIMRMSVPLGLAMFVAGFSAVTASASTLYSDLPGSPYVLGANPTLPDAGWGSVNSSSVPFDLYSVSEFGGLVNLNSTGQQALTGGTIALDNYATAAQYASSCGVTITCDSNSNPTGYYANLTVNAYTVGTPGTYDAGSGDTIYPVVGPAQSTTTTVFIAWDPTGNGPTCAANSQGAVEGNTQPNQCGVINLVNFNLSAVVPSSFIYTVSISGNGTPTGAEGAADSLNFALNTYAAGDPGVGNINAGSIGTSDPDTAYYSVAAASVGCSYYQPLNGCGSLAGDIGWGNQGYGEISFQGTSATPEPATFGLIGFGLLGLGISSRKRNRKS